MYLMHYITLLFFFQIWVLNCACVNKLPVTMTPLPTTRITTLAYASDNSSDNSLVEQILHMKLLFFIVCGLGGLLLIMIIIFVVCKCMQNKKRKATEERKRIQNGRQRRRQKSKAAVHPGKSENRSRKRSRDMTYYNKKNTSRLNDVYVTSMWLLLICTNIYVCNICCCIIFVCFGTFRKNLQGSISVDEVFSKTQVSDSPGVSTFIDLELGTTLLELLMTMLMT